MDRFVDWASPGMAGSAEWVEERRALIDDATLSQVSFAKRRLVPPIPPKDEVWSKLAVPTLLMFGDREVIFDPAAAADRIKALAPQIQLEVLPGVSHDFFVVAADQVNARVLHFLSEVGEHLK
jgi:pimeloyl-ACP methyl ester carboxylesterase